MATMIYKTLTHHSYEHNSRDRINPSASYDLKGVQELAAKTRKSLPACVDKCDSLKLSAFLLNRYSLTDKARSLVKITGEVRDKVVMRCQDKWLKLKQNRKVSTPTLDENITTLETRLVHANEESSYALSNLGSQISVDQISVGPIPLASSKELLDTGDVSSMNIQSEKSRQVKVIVETPENSWCTLSQKEECTNHKRHHSGNLPCKSGSTRTASSNDEVGACNRNPLHYY